MAAEQVLTEVLNESVLTAHDRCDRCGAQAYVRTFLQDGYLSFCGHDFAANEVALLPITRALLDERAKLLES